MQVTLRGSPEPRSNVLLTLGDGRSPAGSLASRVSVPSSSRGLLASVALPRCKGTVSDEACIADTLSSTALKVARATGRVRRGRIVKLYISLAPFGGATCHAACLQWGKHVRLRLHAYFSIFAQPDFFPLLCFSLLQAEIWEKHTPTIVVVCSIPKRKKNAQGDDDAGHERPFRTDDTRRCRRR